MMTFRFRRVPTPTALSSQPRSSLDYSSCTAIDTVLKDIKIFSRRLRAGMTRQEDELQILERLYYKGKNQHRSAHFWKRVAEIRRYGRRLDGMKIPDVVERLRHSFFGDVAEQSTKSLRGSWTHTPDVRYVSFVLERVSACRSLVEKMQERLLAAYQSFTLAMRSGAFLQLVLLLVSIASRMYHLTTEIHESLVFGLSVCQRTLQILDPKCGDVKIIGIESVSVNCSTAANNKSDPMIDAIPDPRLDDAIFEDVGQSVVRQISSIQDAQENSASIGNSLPYTPAPIIEDFDIVILQKFEGAPFSSEISRHTVENVVEIPPDSVSKSKTGALLDAKKRKKKKRRRDAIDDIFGD